MITYDGCEEEFHILCEGKTLDMLLNTGHVDTSKGEMFHKNSSFYSNSSIN